MNALIIETAFLGDAIISLSLARAIREADPSSRISYLVRPDVREVIAASPDVDRVITFDKRGSESGVKGIRTKAEELNGAGFDTLFLLHSSRRSQRLASLIECEIKVGFDAMTHAGLTHTVPDRGWQNRYKRAILPLTAIVPGADRSALPRIIPPAKAGWNPFFRRCEKTVALAPGSVWETKKWGDYKFRELAKRLTHHGIGVVIIGGATEKKIAAEMVADCGPEYVLNLAGEASFLEAMAAVQRSSVIVANDSAPTHGAVAVGTKVITIFGPTVPAFGFAPPVGSGDIIELPTLWCRPCAPHGGHTCPIYTHECMERISVKAVLETVIKTLNR